MILLLLYLLILQLLKTKLETFTFIKVCVSIPTINIVDPLEVWSNGNNILDGDRIDVNTTPSNNRSTIQKGKKRAQANATFIDIEEKAGPV